MVQLREGSVPLRLRKLALNQQKKIKIQEKKTADETKPKLFVTS